MLTYGKIAVNSGNLSLILVPHERKTMATREWLAKEREEKKVRLRIFAYHVSLICNMEKGETINPSPVAGLSVKITRSHDDHYRVNDKCAGNQHGAVAEFAKLVHEFALGLHPDND